MCPTVSIDELLTNPIIGIAGCCPSAASGARNMLRLRTTASPISRMDTSVEDGCRGV
jgi:hypothetical protein